MCPIGYKIVADRALLWRTNVYEEHSLGIYADNVPDAKDGDESKYIMAHVRRQLEFDLWYVFLGLFLICVAEGKRIADANDYVWSPLPLAGLFTVILTF